MKKFLSLMLCIIMIAATFSLVACNGGEDLTKLNGKTAEQLYNEALDKVKGLTNFELDATATISMELNNQTQTIDVKTVSKMDGQNVYVKVDNDMDASANMEAWYVDEVFYGEAAGQKFKAEITYEDYVEKYMPEGATAEGALMQIPEAWFKDTKFIKTSDGMYYIEFVVSGEDYLTYMQNSALGSMLSNIAIDDISYKVYFDKDANLGDIVTEFSMTEQGVKMTATAVSKISNIGTTTITVPEEANSWNDLTGLV